MALLRKLPFIFIGDGIPGMCGSGACDWQSDEEKCYTRIPRNHISCLFSFG